MVYRSCVCNVRGLRNLSHHLLEGCFSNGERISKTYRYIFNRSILAINWKLRSISKWASHPQSTPRNAAIICPLTSPAFAIPPQFITSVERPHSPRHHNYFTGHLCLPLSHKNWKEQTRRKWNATIEWGRSKLSWSNRMVLWYFIRHLWVFLTAV